MEFYVIFSMFIIATYTGVILAILLKGLRQNVIVNNPNANTSPHQEKNADNILHCRTLVQMPENTNSDNQNNKPDDNNKKDF